MQCLDTNVIIDLFRGKNILSNINMSEELGMPSIVLCELYKGAFQSKKEKSLHDINRFLEKCTFITIDETCCRIFGELFIFMRKNGRETPENDLLIASMCIKNNATLVTSNKKHFENIPGLKVRFI